MYNVTVTDFFSLLYFTWLPLKSVYGAQHTGAKLITIQHVTWVKVKCIKLSFAISHVD